MGIIEDTLSYNEMVYFRYMEGGDSVFHSKEERYYDDLDRVVFVKFFEDEIDELHSWDSLYYENNRVAVFNRWGDRVATCETTTTT